MRGELVVFEKEARTLFVHGGVVREEVNETRQTVHLPFVQLELFAELVGPKPLARVLLGQIRTDEVAVTRLFDVVLILEDETQQVLFDIV